MKKTYINGLGCISAQKTFDTVFLEEAHLNQRDTVLPLSVPIYKDYIAANASRRMAKGVKNGMVASALALREAQLETVDAIITGSGMGCIEDSEKFLKTILDNNEEYLTPTSFIQSTHNTVGAQIALQLSCKGYNFTYVNGAISFESALLDAKMQLDHNEANSVLVGGIDENADYTTSLYKLVGKIKPEQATPFDLLKETTSGAVYGEGATFFALENNKNANTYAEILDVTIYANLNPKQVEEEAVSFLQSNNLTIDDVDAIVLGYNGDIDFEFYYKDLSQNLFKKTTQLYYKHLSGEYNTASAFGLWMASKIIKTQTIPEIVKVNSIEKENYKTILLYNQFEGKNHSFTLISK